MKYLLLIGDGAAARTRGLSPETLHVVESKGEDLDDAINNAQEELIDLEWGSSFNGDEEGYTYAEYFNNLDPGCGDIWLLAYIEDGKLMEVYNMNEVKQGKDGEYNFAEPKYAKQFNLPAHIKDKRYI